VTARVYCGALIFKDRTKCFDSVWSEKEILWLWVCRFGLWLGNDVNSRCICALKEFVSKKKQEKNKPTKKKKMFYSNIVNRGYLALSQFLSSID